MDDNYLTNNAKKFAKPIIESSHPDVQAVQKLLDIQVKSEVWDC